MTYDDGPGDGAVEPMPMVFHQAVKGYRRARRFELVGLTGAATIIGLLVWAAGLWPVGLVFVAVGVVSFVIAYPIRWNAEPPLVAIDSAGVTYRWTDLGITFKDRAKVRALAWSDIEAIELAVGQGLESSGVEFVVVAPRRAEVPGISFVAALVNVSERELAAAVATFAPNGTKSIVDRRPARAHGARRDD